MIKGKTAMDAWKKTLDFIISKGQDFVDENGRVCREAFNLCVKIDQPQKDIEKPILQLKKLKEFDYPSLEELRETTLSKYPSEYSYTYGHRIFNYNYSLDQVEEYIIPLLKSCPHSRRAVIVLFNPEKDSSTVRRDTPGMIFIHFRIINNKLTATSFIRSNDYFFGWPANIYQVNVLQKIVAKKLGINTGSLSVISSSAHLFQDQFDWVKKIVK